MATETLLSCLASLTTVLRHVWTCSIILRTSQDVHNVAGGAGDVAPDVKVLSCAADHDLLLHLTPVQASEGAQPAARSSTSLESLLLLSAQPSRWKLGLADFFSLIFTSGEANHWWSRINFKEAAVISDHCPPILGKNPGQIWKSSVKSEYCSDSFTVLVLPHHLLQDVLPVKYPHPVNCILNQSSLIPSVH